MDRKTQMRLKWLIKNKVNHISCTISPAPKAELHIESIGKGIEYYAANGVEEVVIQPKYMGSYCDIYLFNDIEKTYFVSRNGYKINHLDMDAMLEAVKPLHKKLFIDENNDHIKLFIIQSELMPWYAMGKGLIEYEYKPYLKLSRAYAEYFNTNPILDKLKAHADSDKFKEYHKTINTKLKSEYNYPDHIKRFYNALCKVYFKYDDIDCGLKRFEQQLEIHGKDAPISFKPFGILKIVKKNGEELIPEDNALFDLINDDEQVIHKIDVTDPKFINAIYNKYFNEESKLEGIMIKPRYVTEGIAPCLKVRNYKYLHLIYGWDFHSRFKDYYNKRNIKRKLQTSINEFTIARELLKIPYSDIAEDNELYIKLFKARLKQESYEKLLDNKL